MRIFLSKKNKAFTLVETLVAISIFTVSILSLMSILAKGIQDASYVKKRSVAAYLSQEGIEYIVNLRNTYMLYDGGGKQVGWNNFVSKLTTASCQAANGCYFNADNLFTYAQPMPITQVPFTACGSSCPQLYSDSTTGKYSYTPGILSGFIRKISVTQISSDEVKISSTMTWTQGSGAQSVTLSENLFNWIE